MALLSFIVSFWALLASVSSEGPSLPASPGNITTNIDLASLIAFVYTHRVPETHESAKQLNSLLDRVVNEIRNESVDGKYNLEHGYAPHEVWVEESVACQHNYEGDSNEREWTKKRASKALPYLQNYLRQSNLEISHDLIKLMTPDDMPRISMLLSGGGMRAMLNGAGMLRAADLRSSPYGSLGGILQSSLYLLGLSGGSWTLGSLMANEFPTINQLQDEIWNFENSILAYDPSNPDEWAMSYYGKIMKNMIIKRYRGYYLCINDIWAQLISSFTHPHDKFFHLSDVQDSIWFRNHAYPFPVIETALNTQGDPTDCNAELPVMEFTPYAIRSDDPSVNASCPVRYIGTQLNEGRQDIERIGVRGYDVLGFVLGASSMVFAGVKWTVDNAYLKYAIHKLIAADSYALVTSFWPNPFRGFSDSELVSSEETIRLQDGCFTYQNSPFVSALSRSRNSDVFFLADSEAGWSFDGSSDNYPSGKSLEVAYQHAMAMYHGGTSKPMPFIPNRRFLSENGLLKRVVFFGVEEEADIDSPVIIFMPNFEKTAPSNITTFTSKLKNWRRDEIVQNFDDIASNQEKIGGEWSQCISCAVIERWRRRKGFERLDTCAKCFTKYSYYGQPPYDNIYPEPPSLNLTLAQCDFGKAQEFLMI